MFDRLIDFLIDSLRLFQFWIVLDPYERGIQLRLGTFKRILDPGFHFLIPFAVDRVISENIVPRTHRMPGLAATTIDGKAVGFDVVITYCIKDVVKAVLECEDVADAIADTCSGHICTELSKLSWEDLHTKGAPDSLVKVCRARGFKWGIEISNVQLVGAALVKSIRLTASAPTEHSVSIGV